MRTLPVVSAVHGNKVKPHILARAPAETAANSAPCAHVQRGRLPLPVELSTSSLGILLCSGSHTDSG